MISVTMMRTSLSLSVIWWRQENASTNLNSGSYTPLFRRLIAFTTQSATGPELNAPIIEPIMVDIETRPTPEGVKLWGVAEKIWARTLPTTINHDVVMPHAMKENSTWGKINIIRGLAKTLKNESSHTLPWNILSSDTHVFLVSVELKLVLTRSTVSTLLAADGFTSVPKINSAVLSSVPRSVIEQSISPICCLGAEQEQYEVQDPEETSADTVRPIPA